MKIAHAYRLIITGCVIGIGLLWGGCAKDKISAPDAYGSVVASIPHKSLVPAALSFELIVEGRDFGTMTFPMVQDTDSVFGRADSIPVGRDRRVIARAHDLRQGTVLYQGSRTVDIAPGRTVQLSMQLRPVQPMLTITPRYQTMMMDDTIYVDVNVFNIPDLSGIRFDFIRNSSPTFVASVVKGDQYDDQVTLTYLPANDITTIEVSYTNRVAPIVDTLGNAHLATLMIPTYQDWAADTATVIMQPKYLAGYGVGGGTLVLEVFVDDAVVELARPPQLIPGGSQ